MLSLWPCTEILDAVHESNPVNVPLEECWDPGNMHNFQSPWRSSGTQSNHIYWLPHVSDWVDSLISPSGLLLIVSHLLPVPVSLLGVGLENR
jgi:hypothetical protein